MESAFFAIALIVVRRDIYKSFDRKRVTANKMMPLQMGGGDGKINISSFPFLVDNIDSLQ